ncbi:DISARM system phospholipase D-like protein DrmC [Sphaerisporangium sp. NPDC051017]|uniref:DISARM system phospholipase D-like protein DrmC n=1 Tax=Sphaerisporangium sp. NPDC051017 TaxID=3154636 RepID=UPI003430743D
MSEGFAHEVAVLAGEVPFPHVLAWAELLRTAPGPGDEVLARLIEARPSAVSHAVRFVKAWRRHAPEMPGAGVAFGLEAAARVHLAESAARPSIVVSGPTSDAVPVRLTLSAVTEIVRAARESLLVVSFAAYRVDEIARELAAATERGVRVDLILEGGPEEGGTLRGPTGAAAFRLLRGKATFWTWPPNRRPAGASLHAKLLAADRKIALLGSANLTRRALLTNIEIGVILRDPGAVSRIVAHFHTLMRPGSGPLEPVAGGG